jgi:hypothetical protein
LRIDHRHVRVVDDYPSAVDTAIAQSDVVLNRFTALLRIAEVEADVRRASFCDVSLDTILRDVAELYEPVAESRRLSVAVLASEPVFARGDVDLLFGAIENLLDNALKFTLSGAVTGGLAGSGVADSLARSLTQTGAQVAMGAARSVVTQGLSLITGAQRSFDWKGVAASAIASGVGYGVSQTSVGQIPVLGQTVTNIAAGASSTLVRGGSLGKNVGSVSPLPESSATLAQTDGGFLRGLSGDRRSVFEAPAPLSDQVGAGLRWAADTFVLDPLKEVGNQYRDTFEALGGANDGWSSNLARQVSGGDYIGALLTEAGTVGGVMPLAGAGAKVLSTLAPVAGTMAESYAARTGLISYMTENGPSGTTGSSVNAWRTGDSLAEGLTQSQAKNLDRYLDKLPANAQDFRVGSLPNGGAVFQANSPAANSPGSFVTYEKQVDVLGNTVLYTKTTYAPEGRIVHIAPKYPVGPKLSPGQ